MKDSPGWPPNSVPAKRQQFILNMSVPPHSTIHYLVHLAGPINGLVIFLAPPILRSFALQHGSVQLIWFILAACIPAFFTNVMYWVDFAWPWGLSIIGVFVWWWTGVDEEYDTLRRKLICELEGRGDRGSSLCLNVLGIIAVDFSSLRAVSHTLLFQVVVTCFMAPGWASGRS